MWISSPGWIGVNEYFNHLIYRQNLLSVITYASPGDKYGRVQWRRPMHVAHLMHDLTLRKPDQSVRLASLLPATICHGTKIAVLGYLHRQLL